MPSASRQELIEAAISAAVRAYAPYSNFSVGAALSTASGKVFSGCNIENASYGLTICAERVAIFAALSSGEQHFELLAIASPGGASPCGACRQVLSEFATSLPILLVDANTGLTTTTDLTELLPQPFGRS